MSPNQIIKRLCQSSAAFSRFVYSEPTGSLTPQQEEVCGPVKIESSTFDETGWFCFCITDDGREANLRSMEDFLLRSGAVVVKFIRNAPSRKPMNGVGDNVRVLYKPVKGRKKRPSIRGMTHIY